MIQTSYQLVFAATFTLVSLFTTIGVASHPYHVSYAEIEWNAKTGNFEVALCVWPSDLEKAIAAQEKKSIDLDQVEDLDTLIEKYVKKRFVFSSTGTDKVKSSNEIRWVGHEKDLKKAWLYFEVAGQGKNQFSIENQLFFELNEDQSNHVELKEGKTVSSLIFNSANRKHSVSVGQ